MNTDTGHPVARRGGPCALYIGGMAARLAGAALMVAACIALYSAAGGLGAVLGGSGILLYIAGAVLRARSWRCLSRETREHAVEPLWATIAMEAGCLGVFTALPVGMGLSGSLTGIVATMEVLLGAAGAMTATAAALRKDGARAGRVIRSARAAVASALALALPGWVVYGAAANHPGTVVLSVITMLPPVLIPYLGVMVLVLLRAQSKRREASITP